MVKESQKKCNRTFPGCYESLSSIRDFVVQAAQDAGLDREAVYAVELAVDEACCNIIDHAYGGENIGEIKCCATVRSDGLEITLNDRGKPFDPEQVPKPEFDRPIEDVKPRGVGLFLMRKMMDEIHFQSDPQHGNEITLIKRKGQ